MGRKKLLFLSITTLIFLLVTGCSSSIVVFRDEDTKARFVRMTGSRLDGGLSFVALNAQRFEKAEDVSYSLYVFYAGPIFINIDQGKTLILDIDGEVFELVGNGSERYRTFVVPGLVEEKAYYHDVNLDLIKKLAYAEKVEVMLHGSSKLLKRHLAKRHIEQFREFYEYTTKRVVASH